VRDFEERITPHILRNWDRERIVAFATHLLGDTCQGCQKVAEKEAALLRQIKELLNEAK